jgi:acylphosphatase
VKRFEIIVKGIVQKVGYRDYVEEVARRLGIVGFVENVKDGTVRIVCKTDEETIKKFIHEINIKKGLIEVEDVQIKSVGIATGEFKYFEIKYGPLEEEIGERMVMAVKYASAMWSDIKTMSQDLKEVKQDIKEMKQDISEMKQDIREIKGDVKEVLKKQGETIKEIRELRSGS